MTTQSKKKLFYMTEDNLITPQVVWITEAARYRGCTNAEILPRDRSAIGWHNNVVNWLLQNHPDEFELV